MLLLIVLNCTSNETIGLLGYPELGYLVNEYVCSGRGLIKLRWYTVNSSICSISTKLIFITASDIDP